MSFYSKLLEYKRKNNLNYNDIGQIVDKYGDAANIIDLEYPERSGKYLVDKVIKTFSSAGYRRQIYLGKKVSE